MDQEAVAGDYTQPSLISSQRALGDNEGEEEEEEEEQELLSCVVDGSTCTSVIPSVQRGWPEDRGEEEEEEEEEEESMVSRHLGEDTEILPVTSLARMADFMLRCLNRDPRVVKMLGDSHYWLVTLVDPRYKENFHSLIPEVERSTKMGQYQKALAAELLKKFPSEHASGRGHSSLPNQGVQAREMQLQSSRGRGTLSTFWDSFLTPAQLTGPEARGTLTRSGKFQKMVREYLADRTSVLRDSSVPFNYWVSKLDTWNELALYALEVLACPAASVLSERVFSAAGGIITDKRTRLSTDNADKLTLIKMNKGWIGPDFSSPPNDSRVT